MGRKEKVEPDDKEQSARFIEGPSESKTKTRKRGSRRHGNARSSPAMADMSKKIMSSIQLQKASGSILNLLNKELITGTYMSVCLPWFLIVKSSPLLDPWALGKSKTTSEPLPRFLRATTPNGLRRLISSPTLRVILGMTGT
jgi:hypothetical protein